MRRELWASAGGLWLAQATHKAAVLAFSLWVGRSLGAEGVGVMASTLAMCWVVGNVAGLGLPDRSVFDGAADRRPRELYGWFLVLGVGATLFLLTQAAWVAQHTDESLVFFAQGLILGAGAQGLSAVGFGWLRGAARPTSEVWGTLAASAILFSGGAVPEHLGMIWAASGLCLLLSAVAGGLRDGRFIPALPRRSGLLQYLRQTWAYWALGLGAWLVGNADLLMGRALLESDDVGHLQVGTMAVRGLGLLPWVAASLMLKDVRRRWAEGHRPSPVRWTLNVGAVGVLVAGMSWIVLPFLARGHGMTVSAVASTATASMVIAPAYFSLVLLVPLAAQWHLGRTLKALAMGLMAQVSVLWVLGPQPAGATLILAMGVGQLVTLMWLNQVLRSSPQQSLQVDSGAA